MSELTKIAREKSVLARLPSNAANATVNRAGGVAFEIDDPVTKLITMTGGAFFSEPKFYDAAACIPSRDNQGKLKTLAKRIEIINDKVQSFASCDELPDSAREIVATAVDVARGKTPEDILIVANWLRNEMNIRLTPQVLLVIASRIEGSKSLVRKYAPKIIRRPDEVKVCLLMHRFLFGFKNLANGLANGLGDALNHFGERGLMKYDDAGFPTWKDVLCWLPRKMGWPLKNEVSQYFKTGKVLDPLQTPIIAARKQLSLKKVFDDESKDLARKSQVNWEVLLSQFGNDKKAVWSFLIENDLIGYMALLRNLRNILEAKVSRDLIQRVVDKISSKDEVLKSKQLPFRFLSALRSLQTMNADVDGNQMTEFMSAVEVAANAACENITKLPGMTVICADVSGSMEQPVSKNSTVTCMDAATVLCGIVAKTSDQPYVIAFASEAEPVRWSKTDSVLSIATKTKETDTHGWATNGHKCVEWMMDKGLVPDRIIFLSDMQMWNSCTGEHSLANAWKSYLRGSPAAAKKTWVHCIHVNGYGDNAIQGDRVNLLSGFSEKVFTMLAVTEGLTGNATPTIDQIREKWTVK